MVEWYYYMLFEFAWNAKPLIQLPFFFFSLLLTLFLEGVPSVVLVEMCDQDRESLLDTPTNYCVYVLKFHVCEHCMPCALGTNSNGGSTLGHVESCPSTTTNIISPPPQCPWPPNWHGRHLHGAPTHKVTWQFYHVVMRDHVTNENHLSPVPECLWPPKLAEV